MRPFDCLCAPLLSTPKRAKAARLGDPGAGATQATREEQRTQFGENTSSRHGPGRTVGVSPRALSPPASLAPSGLVEMTGELGSYGTDKSVP